MQLMDPDGLVSMIGLLAQTVVAWILFVIFALLLRPSGRPRYFRDWTWALFALAIGLTAVTTRFFLPVLDPSWNATFPEGALATKRIYLIYQAGKCFFGWGLLVGALRLVRGDAAVARLRWAPPAVAAFAALSTFCCREIEFILFWQAMLLVPTCLLAAHLLGGLPRARRTEGARIARIAFLGTAAVWVAYGVNAVNYYFTGHNWWQHGTWMKAVLAYNSYFDLVLLVALTAGMIVLLLQELQRVSQLAQGERARLELELERGERLRSLGALVSTVAHDLNNPLTAVLGFAGELERSHAGTEDGQSARIVREQAERCRGIVQRLSTLVSDHPAPRRPVAPADLLHRVARGLQPRFDEAGIRLEVRAAAELPAVQADPYGLEEALDNLLDNALRAAPPRTTVRLSAEVRDGDLLLCVEDQGRGIPDALRARVFEPFFTTRRNEGGTGLGLAVARGIARAHGGSLTLEPGAGGARFHLRIPIPEPAVAAQAAPVAEAAQSAAPAGGRRILVVDDEALVRKVLRTQLRRLGWIVEEAEDGVGALAELAAAPFAVVLCDLRMPRMSGYAVHDELARRDPATLARFVFVSGDLASPEAAAFAARCRQPIVHKPFDFHDLEAAIARVTRPAGEVAPLPAPSFAPALLVLTLAAGLGACGGEAAPAARTEAAASGGPAAPAPVSSGSADASALYAQHCALCHGPNGDGDGVVKLDRPARSFRAGGFSFGNTEEAVFRTITSGIGGSPMPGFQSVLGEAERRALARHVIALGPEATPGPGLSSILTVATDPVVVRGQLPPLAAGGPEFPRALMVGNPDGMSFAYRADDVRLLAVYQGPFVDRKDWGERGGLPLEPLGRPIFLTDPAGDPAPEWSAGGQPLRARLLGTTAIGPRATLRYALLNSAGATLATVEESCRATAYPSGTGFVRELQVEVTQTDAPLAWRPAPGAPADAGGAWTQQPMGSGVLAVRSARPRSASGAWSVETVLLVEPAAESFRALVEAAR